MFYKLFILLASILFIACSNHKSKDSDDYPEIKDTSTTRLKDSSKNNPKYIRENGYLRIIDTSELKLESGTWEGQYQDIHGFDGKITLKIQTAGNNFSGTLNLDIGSVDTHDLIKGTVEGNYHGDSVSFFVKTRKFNTMKDSEVHFFTGKLRDNHGSFAKQTIYGVANVPTGIYYYLGGGTWIIWRWEENRQNVAK